MIGWTHLSGTTVSLVGGDSGVLMSHKLLAQNLHRSKRKCGAGQALFASSILLVLHGHPMPAQACKQDSFTRVVCSGEKSVVLIFLLSNFTGSKSDPSKEF
jgi:hypothetical protein